MKAMYAISLGLVLGAAAAPTGDTQSESHKHPAPTPQSTAVAAPTQDAKPMAGMACDPEMHAKMEQRMQHMESMMEKMHGGPGAGSHPEAKPSANTPEHEHEKE